MAWRCNIQDLTPCLAPCLAPVPLERSMAWRCNIQDLTPCLAPAPLERFMA